MEPKDCGCELTIQEVDGNLDTQAFKFCPMHKAAPALLSALGAMLREWDKTQFRHPITEEARAAILAAKGDK